jgi:hypothetical protein
LLLPRTMFLFSRPPMVQSRPPLGKIRALLSFLLMSSPSRSSHCEFQYLHHADALVALQPKTRLPVGCRLGPLYLKKVGEPFIIETGRRLKSSRPSASAHRAYTGASSIFKIFCYSCSTTTTAATGGSSKQERRRRRRRPKFIFC